MIDPIHLGSELLTPDQETLLKAKVAEWLNRNQTDMTQWIRWYAQKETE